MIGLLAPLFLLGALAVAIPIVVHLVHRERKEPLAFPSLMFLRRVPFRSARRQRIRYWLLFLARTAALLLVAAAFARPWLNRMQPTAHTSRNGKDVVVLIDRSYSMSARAVWQRARSEAARAVDAAADGDRVAVIAFGEQAQQLARLDEPRSRAGAAVRALQPSSEATRYEPAFKLAGSVLAQSRGPAEIVVITDAQRSGWRAIEQVAVPPGTTVRVVDVRAARIQDIAITDALLARSTFAGRQRVAPSARVVNRGAEPVTITVELRMNGRVSQARQLTIAANASAPVQFDGVFAGQAAGEMRVTANDDIAVDDVVYFTTDAHSAPVVRVLSSSPDARFYFENALAAGDAAGFTLHPVTRLTAADLAETDVVVLLDAALPGGAVGDSLRSFIRAGGGLIMATAARIPENPLWPLQGGRVIENESAPASLVALDETHPVFAPFRRAGDGAFASARITRYLRAQPVADASVLARFDDGAPAVVEKRIGRGRVLVVPASFTRAAGDLVLQPSFVPFAQELVRYAAAGAHVARAYQVGSVIDVNSLAAADRDAVVVTPTRQRVRLAPARGARTLRIDEPGIYQISGGAQGGTELIAGNVDVAESDVTRLDKSLFADAITERDRTTAAALAPLTSGEREQQQSIWWYLLVIAFVLFLVETLAGNRISTAWRT